MKLQLDGARLRLRIGETELSLLLSEGQLEQHWPCPDGQRAKCLLRLDATLPAPTCAGNPLDLEVALPRMGFLAFAEERPRRDGYSFSTGTVAVSVEVDVRDSRRVRGAQSGHGVGGGAVDARQ